MKLDDDLKKIIAKVANRNSTRHEDAEFAYRHFLSELKNQMTKKESVNIKIHNFGRFELNMFKLDKRIEQMKEAGEDPKELVDLKEEVVNKKHKRNVNKK